MNMYSNGPATWDVDDEGPTAEPLENPCEVVGHIAAERGPAGDREVFCQTCGEGLDGYP